MEKGFANRVAFIQDVTAVATWRHVPSQFNHADLISGGIEPTTLSSSTLWWKEHNGFHKSHPGGLSKKSPLLLTAWKSESYILHVYQLQKTSHNDSPSRTDSSESWHTADDSSITAGIIKTTGI